VFIHASTSPNAQIIASLDVARRQMELEGYELVRKAIEISLAIRKSVNEHPIISKYFKMLGSDGMIPAEFRSSGFKDFLAPGTNWLTALKAVKDDEFFLDPTRMTLVCGTAGFDGSSLKGLLASKYNIQLNKTSRNSVLLQSNINNTRSDVALLIKVLLEISQDIEARLAEGGELRARRVRGEGQEPDDGCARPAELQPLPRWLPRKPEEHHARGRHARRVLRRL
jgi:arginine decarboxylase